MFGQHIILIAKLCYSLPNRVVNFKQKVYILSIPPTELSLVEDFCFSLPIRFIIWMECDPFLSLFLIGYCLGYLFHSSLLLV